jgi:transposase
MSGLSGSHAGGLTSPPSLTTWFRSALLPPSPLVGRLHWDMTSFSLHGAYDQANEDHPAPRYGHPKDRRPDLLQVQAGIAAVGDGGIPVYHRAYDGGAAAEVSQVTGAMTSKKIAGAPKMIYIHVRITRLAGAAG